MRLEVPFSDSCSDTEYKKLSTTPAHCLSVLVLVYQINELSQVPPPVMLLPDDFKASSKIKVNNHLFHRYTGIPTLLMSTFLEKSNT